MRHSVDASQKQMLLCAVVYKISGSVRLQ